MLFYTFKTIDKNDVNYPHHSEQFAWLLPGEWIFSTKAILKSIYTIITFSEIKFANRIILFYSYIKWMNDPFAITYGKSHLS